MSNSSSRDNWERLVAAVVKREQIWQLCHQDSITTTASDYTSDYTDVSLSFPSVRPVSSPSPQLPLINDSIIEDGKNASKTISRKLFSALRWKRKPKDCDLRQGLVGIPEYGLESFSLRELLVATDNFSDNNVIGRGEHGTIYKGRLEDGSVVAVKRLQQQVNEVELEMASLVSHRNIIKLIGCCITRKEQLLVYPFMQNGNVASCLKGTQPTLDWPVRKYIALGVAKGLAYLHEECIKGIIHRDVKAANILLDEDLQAVVADFTLAKFMDCREDGAVKGTLGHIAPEYLSTGECTEKTDVFSFGIFLLELITGQNIPRLHWLAGDGGMGLLELVYTIYRGKLFDVMVDSSLEGSFVEEEVEKFFQLVLICTQKDPDERPTMLGIVRMIDGLADRRREFLTHSFGSEQYPSEDVPPATEWILTDSSSFTVEDKLSSPR